MVNLQPSPAGCVAVGLPLHLAQNHSETLPFNDGFGTFPSAPGSRREPCTPEMLFIRGCSGMKYTPIAEGLPGLFLSGGKRA